MSVEITTLSCGLRVVTERMPSLASAAVGIWVEAGARNETAAQNGIAHFLEHMAFKGTERRSARRIAEEIEEVGGYVNAYTSRERTAYYARVMGRDVPLAVDLIADILRASTLDEAELELERGVILQEIAQTNDTPDDVIFDWLQEEAFPGQPLGRAILGPPERVRGFARADLADFVAEHYAPERMILSAAGDVDHAAIAAQAEALYGDMAPRSAPAMEPGAYRGGERRVVRALEQAHLAMAFSAPSYLDEGYHAAQIASVALGGGMSSRLFQEVREKRGLCYTIFAQNAAWSDAGALMLYAGTGEAELAGLAHLATDELARAAEDLTEAEIARAKAQCRAGLVMGLESPSARAERMASMLAIWGRVPPIEEAVAKIDAVDATAARAALTAAVTSPPTLALLGPVGGAPDVADLAGRLAA
ncbi:MAG: pitrilysin family protein [Pseudomonadota bacterium]